MKFICLWEKLRDTAAFVRLSHAVFALPFALVALLVAANGFPPLVVFLKIMLAVFLARNAAMAFNRLMDVEFDRHNPRTRNRHLVTGKLSAVYGWMFFTLNVAGFLVVAASFNRMAGWLALPTLAWLCFYSLAKRFTALSHFILGASLALAPLGAWVAVRGEISRTPLPLALAVLFWVAGFDVLYAAQDEAFDRERGLHSLVVTLGQPRALWLARLCHALMIPLLMTFAHLAAPVLGVFFWTAIGVIALLLIWEHRLVRPGGDLTRINDAFFRVNGVVSLLILLAAALDLLFGA